MDKIKITIIGAGVVGLAIAAELSQKYEDIVVLEKHEKFGQETSSRHSEVIHPGIYYPPNSLKAGLCVEGTESRVISSGARNLLIHRFRRLHGLL